ncbi:Ankyrin repeat protein [Aspergillus nomiae NRRL 13137]|uniref:Ankyrin repeat protein n=1 Tax=Aspergillus nomiae NRRL (strain ATCC 15546 / NRRL 13137 / CBS 260.88 / M93) TaxID=1509407 RepID=A0A0L1JBP0_ASPN3|nr:Ankyrin repeat protein [Aspergillus nomiae NRRL 13137]KNG89130.1 Ankyrin repeat protein [Aspergillus nomiae NRRL 13137]
MSATPIEEHQSGLPPVPRQTSPGIIREMETACAVGDLPRFKSTLETWTSLGLDIHDLDSVMMQAVRQDQMDVVVELLHKGLSISQYYALEAIKHRSKKVLNILLQHGWNINQPTSELRPPALGYAVDDDEIALWLLDHGADPNKQCSIDLTPLSYAVEQASLLTVKLFLDRGGDIHKGQLLHHAVERQTNTIDVLGMLLERGFPLNAKMYERHYPSWRLFYFMGLGTALHKAAELGKADVVRYLLEQGADVGIKDATNRTAMDWAVLNNHQEVVGLLQSVERGHRL